MRVLIVWAVQSVALLVVIVLTQDKIEVSRYGSGYILAFVAILGLLNALIWPLITKVMLPFTVYTLGLATFVFNGIMISLVAGLMEGVEIGSFWDSVSVAFWLTIVNTLFSTLLSIDDSDSFFRNSLKKAMTKQYTPDTSKDGVIFLEIDGLAEPILKRAMEQGHMPNLARWYNEGKYKLIQWEPDWSSQTGASQAGILLGSNVNIPGFRWVDKANNCKIVESNGAKDAPLIEAQHSSGNGLLKNNGASRSNLFSGESDDNMFTFSTLTGIKKLYNKGYYSFFSKPYNYVRTIMFTVWDAIKDIQNRRYQVKHNVMPRNEKKRKGAYPLMRAFTTVFLRDLTIYTLIGDIYAGQKTAIYATFVGYDEVAHHSGIDDPDAFYTLKMLDKQFGKLELASHDAARKYHFVVLSDHGQTKGSTFKQRYHMTLEDLVRSALPKNVESISITESNEGLGHVNAVFTEYASDPSTLAGKTINKTMKKNIDDGVIEIGATKEVSKLEEKVEVAKPEVIVLASRNLGLIYFTNKTHRLTLEEIDKEYPEMIKTLTQHEGIGFIMIQSSQHGPVVIGKNGRYFLDSNKIEGENPLATFGPNAPRHVKRSSTFNNVADIMVNSFYKPDTNEGAAFEELIGFHGGLGGTQTQPFVMYPADWQDPAEHIIGAENVHKVLHGWVDTATSTKTQEN